MDITNQQIEFYNDNGYLVLKDVFKTDAIDSYDESYRKLRSRFAKECNIVFEDYEREISQIRDLWHHDETFNKLLLNSHLPSIASKLMGQTSSRLLHDHIINKTKDNNDDVPWHQDYTYWPIDNPNGLSLWLPFMNLDENGGVLEVIPKSHKKGEAKPVDFINDKLDFSKETTIKLEVNKGDLVVLHCLTWHKTGTNTSVENRVAYISLWIPSDSKYEPSHANWHPVNDNVTVKQGEELNSDWFPVVGNYHATKSSIPLKYFGPDADDKFTMFNASKKVKSFLIQNLNIDPIVDIWKHLYDNANRERIVNYLCKQSNFCEADKELLNTALRDMAINGISYNKHKARNVYNKSYVAFKHLFGL
jgi:ectoine hydroxylase-related dioxygenase (phytanoyl-CoA dioxygenase family)